MRPGSWLRPVVPRSVRADSERELILDVGLVEQSLEGLSARPSAIGHAGAILQDQVVALVSCEVIRISTNQGIKRVVHRIGGGR